jgi:hypothetical protein
MAITNTRGRRPVTIPGGNTQYKTDQQLVGTIDGSNRIFTTPDIFLHDPPDTSVQVYINGQRIYQDRDYTISESGGVGTGYDTITFVAPPIPGPPDPDYLSADYFLPASP